MEVDAPRRRTFRSGRQRGPLVLKNDRRGPPRFRPAAPTRWAEAGIERTLRTRNQANLCASLTAAEGFGAHWGRPRHRGGPARRPQALAAVRHDPRTPGPPRCRQPAGSRPSRRSPAWLCTRVMCGTCREASAMRALRQHCLRCRGEHRRSRSPSVSRDGQYRSVTRPAVRSAGEVTRAQARRTFRTAESDRRANARHVAVHADLGAGYLLVKLGRLPGRPRARAASGNRLVGDGPAAPRAIDELLVVEHRVVTGHLITVHGTGRSHGRAVGGTGAPLLPKGARAGRPPRPRSRPCPPRRWSAGRRRRAIAVRSRHTARPPGRPWRTRASRRRWSGRPPRCGRSASRCADRTGW